MTFAKRIEALEASLAPPPQSVNGMAARMLERQRVAAHVPETIEEMRAALATYPPGGMAHRVVSRALARLDADQAERLGGLA